MTTIHEGAGKALETSYQGYRFRSRLEARWAVFFDYLRVPWEYEPQGFDLGEDGWYLPDFFLPTIGEGLWVEIKGVQPTKQEEKKLIALCAATNKKATFRVGEPFINIVMAVGGEDQHNDGSYHELNARFYTEHGADDWPYLFCVCNHCGKVGFQYAGRGDRVCKGDHTSQHGDKGYSGGDARIVNAALAARGARFEYGESGYAPHKRRTHDHPTRSRTAGAGGLGMV